MESIGPARFLSCLMKFLTQPQKQEILAYMQEQERTPNGVNYRRTAAWAFARFGIEVSAYECFDLLCDSEIEDLT
jgi:hypothetical protein